MALRTLAHTLADAEHGGYAAGAFKGSGLNQAVAVFDAVRAERFLVIVRAISGTSADEDRSWWWRRPRAVIKSDPDVDATLYLDHCRTVGDCVHAMDHGLTKVMIHASRSARDDEANDYETNIEPRRGCGDRQPARWPRSRTGFARSTSAPTHTWFGPLPFAPSDEQRSDVESSSAIEAAKNAMSSIVRQSMQEFGSNSRRS